MKMKYNSPRPCSERVWPTVSSQEWCLSRLWLFLHFKEVRVESGEVILAGTPSQAIPVPS